MNKHILVVRETVTREWHITVEGAENIEQVEEWWLAGKIPVQQSDKCELVDEESDTEVLNIYE
jgi:hypothetical protein